MPQQGFKDETPPPMPPPRSQYRGDFLAMHASEIKHRLSGEHLVAVSSTLPRTKASANSDDLAPWQRELLKRKAKKEKKQVL